MSRRGRPPKPEDVAGPTPERLARGDVARVVQAFADEAGRPARPYRTVDTLARLLRNGTITPAMRQAADDFRGQFARAALDPLRAPDLRRSPDSQRFLEPAEQQEDARKRVWRALQALGGIASPAGSCCWHVIGCEWSVRQWAQRQGWGGRAVSEESAMGVLVGALGVLQALYGL